MRRRESTGSVRRSRSLGSILLVTCVAGLVGCQSAPLPCPPQKTASEIDAEVYRRAETERAARLAREVEQLRADLKKMVGGDVRLDIYEINKPELEGQIVAEQIADQLRRRMPFRRTLKRQLEFCRERGAKGVKLQISGRLGGADIARTETAVWGQIPLQTLRADIRYGYAISRTTYGTIGVKAWIYRGEYGEAKDDGVLRKERRNAPNA